MATFTIPAVLPLLHQSQHVAFSEWISLFTLLLAPIIAHIIAGVPQPTYPPSFTPPKWHDYIALYSPITIIWRYAAITDRRIRARRSARWGPEDVASANAIFWTSEGWDGAEGFLHATYTGSSSKHEYLVHYARLPPSGHATLLSVDTVKTAIVTLQGLQAVYLLVGGLVGTVGMPWMAVDTVSFPLAFLGLTRLCAAGWITSDYEFQVEVGGVARGKEVGCEEGVDKTSALGGNRHCVVVEVDGMPVVMRGSGGGGGGAVDGEALSSLRFLVTSWPSRIFRGVYIAPIVVFWLLSLGFALPGPWQSGRAYPLTNYLSAVNGSLSFLFILVVYGYYTARVGCRSTVIPCIGKPWYKVIMCVGYTTMLCIVVISALETRRAPCGVYTTTGKEVDHYVCAPFVSP